ncbi:MAG: redoxin domain-containing protein [Planctomycetota bacterium]
MVELEALQSSFERLQDKGAKLVALCPQKTEANRAISEQLNLQFPVLQDRDNSAATLFGLTIPTPPDVIAAEQYLGLNLPEFNGNSNWDLPMPARYVIDSNGLIQYVSVHPDHRQRSEPELCIGVID